ncbi:MAG TPA: DsbA family protein [Rhizomicrobium sp.]|jgi:protein-disulfide isomerase|nr:DsbA family protein [Rhizomicrobium sp.]
MSRKLILVLGLVVLAAAGTWYFWGTSKAVSPAESAPKTSFEVLPQDHVQGNPKAKVVLIEYAALTCPHCAMFNRQVMPQIRKNYIDTGKVLYVFRLYPRMPEDSAAERLARCVPKDRYFQVIDLLFDNQQHWDPEFGVLDVRGGLTNVGQIAGLSREQIDKCLADSSEDARINAAAQEGAARYNITGTPTLVINGKAQPSGGLPYESLAPLLDQAGAR